MFTCPQCAQELQPQPGANGVVYTCPVCKGHGVGIAVLRRVFGPERVAVMWADESGGPGCKCPVCFRPMQRVTWTEQDDALTLDLCRRCEFVWFDPSEFESLKPAPPPAPPLGTVDVTKLTPDQRQQYAMAKLKLMELEQKPTGEPDEGWKMLPAMLGLPVEIDVIPGARLPILTYVTAVFIALMTLVEFLTTATGSDNVVQRLGLIPAQWSRDGGLTFITSFFLHGGLLHLVGNLYFLVVFGRHVEQYLGSGRWLLLLASAAFVGDVIDVAFTINSTIPTIGASGGISGLLAFYALKFPHAQLGIWIRFAWIPISARTAFALWILFQCAGAWAQIHHQGSVASLAHLGGVLAGVVAYFAWKDFDAKPSAPRGGLPDMTVQ